MNKAFFVSETPAVLLPDGEKVARCAPDEGVDWIARCPFPGGGNNHEET